MPEHAVIFDFDGVVVDTETLGVEVSVQLLSRRFGVELSAEDRRSFYGLYDPVYYERLRTRHRLEATTEELLAAHYEIYDERLGEVDETLPGVVEALDRFRDAGWAVGLCSGSFRHQIDGVLDRLTLHGHFEALVSAEDTERHKPDPAPYLFAAGRLEVEPRHCLVLEDSEVGIASARAAGMQVVGIGIGSRGNQELAAADERVWSLEERCLEDFPQFGAIRR